MSIAQTQPQVRQQSPTLGRAIVSEILATKHSAATRLPIVGLVICLLQAASWALVRGPGAPTWEGLLSWQALSVTALYGPIVSVTVSAVVTRHQSARGGGTWWRPVRMLTRTASLTTVCLLVVATVLAASVLPVLFAGWILIGDVPGPVGRVSVLLALLFCGCLSLVAFVITAARCFGFAAGVVVGVVWQVIGTLRAESSTWWAEPWAVPVRGALPLLGIQANGVPLETDSPIYDTSISLAVTLSLVFGVSLLVIVICALRLFPSHSSVPVGMKGAPLLTRVASRAPSGGAVALALPLLRTSVPLLSIGAAALLLTSHLAWGGSAADSTFGLFVLPAGAGILGVQMWTTTQPAWRRLCSTIGTPCAIRSIVVPCVVPIVVGSTVVAVAVSNTAVDFVRLSILGSLLGTTIVVSALTLTMRFGPPVGWIVTAIALVLGLTFGGSVLADGFLWLAGPTAWAASADTWTRVAIAVAIVVLCLVAAAQTLWSSGHRAAKNAPQASN